MQQLLNKLEEKMRQQTIRITYAVTKSIMEAIDEKLKYITEENKKLRTQITKLESKITFLEKEKRRKNFILFGIEEKERNENDLVQNIKEVIEEADIKLDCQEIATAFRIGQLTCFYL